MVEAKGETIFFFFRPFWTRALSSDHSGKKILQSLPESSVFEPSVYVLLLKGVMLSQTLFG